MLGVSSHTGRGCMEMQVEACWHYLKVNLSATEAMLQVYASCCSVLHVQRRAANISHKVRGSLLLTCGDGQPLALSAAEAAQHQAAGQVASHKRARVVVQPHNRQHLQKA